MMNKFLGMCGISYTPTAVDAGKFAFQTAAQANVITAQVFNMIFLLYSLPSCLLYKDECNAKFN